MTLFQAAGLAIIQSLTEFLPVSSSGHLVIARALFGWSDDGGLAFDTVLHAGSLSAILVYFWRDWLGVALLPGASRSGWTTGGGMLVGQARDASVRFSFFMAIPAIGGAIVLQQKKILESPAPGMAPLPLGLGFLVSLGAIHFCLKFFRAHSLRGFAVYLAAAGALLVLADLWRAFGG